MAGGVKSFIAFWLYRFAGIDTSGDFVNQVFTTAYSLESVDIVCHCEQEIDIIAHVVA